LLASADSPVIIAGDGCARSGAVAELVQLAEMLGVRAHSEPLNALLDFPTGHSLYAGPLVPNAKETRARLEGVDVILIIGANNLAPLVYTGIRMLPPGVRIVQVDPDDREIGKNYYADVAIHGDPKSVLEELNEAIASRLDTAARERIVRRREATAQRIAASRAKFAEQAESARADGPIPPALAAREMRRAAAGSAVLVDEAVTSTGYVRALFELNEPHSYFYAKGGSLGLGLPMAVGVKLAMPDRQVICAVGDGCSLYTIQGLWTAARYRLGILFVIFNNSSYVILKGGLLAMRGESVKRGLYVGMDITDPEIDFVKLAESMGVAARRAVRPSELRPAFDWALSQTGPSLVDVAISRDVQSILR
ncbi:MAG TPA: thiamine pyrophosphate-dependent enzyme, partial [Blastocatellia bacterium]|nr:thiamine pyrophosphate-dependent enzyme [Blastocatellia bacterium]